MAKGGEQAISIIFDVDTEQGQKNIKGLTTALNEAEHAAKGAEGAANSFANIIGGIGKIAVGAFGMVTAVLKAPIDLDNYLGNLNQKITQVGGNLNQYKNMLVEFKTAGTFRPGEGGFGLEDQDYKKIMMQFATGTAAIEKYGAAAASNLKGFTGGSGMLMKVLGFSPEQATAALTDLHKTAGLTFKEMEPFAKQLGSIGKSANLSSTQMASLVGQVTKLSKAYGMGAEQAKKFVLDSVAVGAAISQMGLNVQETIARMNQVAEGSEEGLIQSLLLGFKPGDAKGQLAAFQNQAKMIVAQAQGAGEQFAPFIIRQMADAMGMKGFSVEQIQRMAGGGMVEGPGGPKQKDATSLLSEILEQTKKQGKEGPFVTIAQESNNFLNHIQAYLINTFDHAFQDLKAMFMKLPGYFNTFTSWLSSIHKFFGSFDLSLKNVALAAVGLLALPKIIGGLPSLLIGLMGWLVKTGMGGAAGAAGFAGSGVGAIVASTLAVVLSAAGGAAIGTFIRKYILSDKANAAIGDFLLHGLKSDNQKIAEENISMMKVPSFAAKASEAFETKYGYPGTETQVMREAVDSGMFQEAGGQKAASQFKDTGAIESFIKGLGGAGAGMTTLTDKSGADFQTSTGLGSFLKGKGLSASNFSRDQNNPNEHVLGSKHPAGYAVDIPLAGLKPGQADDLIKSAQAQGFWVEDMKLAKDHIHIEDKKGYAQAMAQKNTGGFLGGLLDVHDSAANATLNEIKHYLMTILHQKPAIAGATSPPDPTAEDLPSVLQGAYRAPNFG